jgi:hypothetical protein
MSPKPHTFILHAFVKNTTDATTNIVGTTAYRHFVDDSDTMHGNLLLKNITLLYATV